MKKVSSLLVNDFEEICVKRLAEIESVRQELVSHGAMGARMSGSGSAVFGLFESEKAMQKCRALLEDKGLFCRGFEYI